MPNVGPTANLPARARRLGRGGTCFRDGKMLGEVTAVEWDVEADQIEVLIPGSWRTEFVPGGEARRATLRMQDVDDRWRIEVYRFFKARREGNFAAQPPVFDLTTKLVGGPAETQWMLIGCQLFGYSGGYSNEDDLLGRELAMTFNDDKPLNAYEYTGSGEAVSIFKD